MGLGLAVSYGIIRRHEGGCEVESELGRGTTFRIRLPMAKFGVKAVPTGELSAPASLPQRAVKTSMLVVDDEEHVRELLRDILEKENCEVALADNGQDALLQFKERRFDAIFTDVGLPGMSGWELARAIRERDDQIPLAVVTGWGEAVGSHEQKAAGVNWVVAKPFTVDQIVGIAREVSHRQEKQLEPVSSIVAA